ncbi:hypothetical protein GGS26DRAFT_544218 [Hypomontagnella submonticulosa]|nr:hypothetical protein GGS26DRAFT_544218 [Hypomontagnella submonticulosa]
MYICLATPFYLLPTYSAAHHISGIHLGRPFKTHTLLIYSIRPNLGANASSLVQFKAHVHLPLKARDLLRPQLTYLDIGVTKLQTILVYHTKY